MDGLGQDCLKSSPFSGYDPRSGKYPLADDGLSLSCQGDTDEQDLSLTRGRHEFPRALLQAR